MAKHRRESKGKSIRPVYYVFCEGESEETYIKYLKTKFRVPVEIVPKILRNKVSVRKINENIKKSQKHDKDRIYLIYDLDVKETLGKLKAIQKQTKSELILSNPCFELWYLLHFVNQNAELSTDDCIKKLMEVCPTYKKGDLSFKLKEKLQEKNCEAVKRAQKHEPYKNPSTNVYKLVEEIESIVL